MSTPMVPQADEVLVRMYRQGLGDCFLLAFPGAAGAPRYVMIDCGLITGARDRSRIKAVVQDIRDTTGGTVHLLVVTHEHWDHVSGFLEAETQFSDLTVEQLWLAWTEDPRNELANRLRAEREQKVAALREAARKGKGNASLKAVEQLVEFFGAAAGRGTKEALGKARELVGTRPIQYCYPHQSQELSGVDGVRVYFLGPPEDERLIRRINPSTRTPEVYTEPDEDDGHSRGRRSRRGSGAAAVPSREMSFMMAARYAGQAPAGEDGDLYERCFPFDQRYRISEQEAEADEFFIRHHGFGSRSATVPPDGDESDLPIGPRWRRIDDDWLEAAGELALALDSVTNNTSLALAFELAADGKVLLFPADAQVGNWLSWHLAPWTVTENDSTRSITARDLLARTVLYKVGHHGSHNATMRAQGLELMTSPDLVAMVPVDVFTAHEVKGWRRMPFEPLVAELRARARGRVLQIDQHVPGADQPPEGAEPAVWQEFVANVASDDLFFQYRLKR